MPRDKCFVIHEGTRIKANLTALFVKATNTLSAIILMLFSAGDVDHIELRHGLRKEAREVLDAGHEVNRSPHRERKENGRQHVCARRQAPCTMSTPMDETSRYAQLVFSHCRLLTYL